MGVHSPAEEAPFRDARPHATRLALAFGAVGVAALAVGATLGLLQILYRAGVNVLPSGDAYYDVLTAHGTLLGYTFPLFFGAGLQVYYLARGLQEDVPRPRVAWAGFGLMLLGTLTFLAPVALGEAAVLWTFYVPLQASTPFYVGLTVFVLGTWVLSWAGLAWAFRRRRRLPDGRFPLMAYGTVSTMLLWVIGSVGIVVSLAGLIIPWVAGGAPTPDPEIHRSLFWFTGHPIVYVWLLPAYVVWYTHFPTIAGGRLFSDALGRVVFLMLFLFSLPVGFHHQFLDPGIPESWKALHTFNTFIVVIPSLLTAFTILASLEYAARKRGGEGLFRWVGSLPWREPAFAAIAWAFILFGGAGVSGVINAGLQLNSAVHNTTWVVAHFHVALATGVGLTFMGITYWLLPQLTGRDLALKRWATAQSYMWAAGIAIFATTLYAGGVLEGIPRRIARPAYQWTDTAIWYVYHGVAAAGGALMLLSVFAYLAVVVATVRAAPHARGEPTPLNRPLSGAGPRLLDRWGLWVMVALVLVAIAWVVPIMRLALNRLYL